MKIWINGNNYIGDDSPCYVIVDVGANHNRDFQTAKELILSAAKMGADAIKFQTYTAEKLYSKKTPMFSKDITSPFDLIKSLQHPPEWLPILSDIAKEIGITFLSTPFDFEAVDLLEDIGVPLFKIASPEIVDLELVDYISKKQKPIILSTGMADIGEIEEATNTILKNNNNNIILLHCNTLYPAPVEIVNLKAINTLKNVFKYPVGFSDHTLGFHISLAAVSIGAKVIEKHFTLDRNQNGPDHHFAIEPLELKELVHKIREIEKAMGNGLKKPSNLELKENYRMGRRSIIAAIDIPKSTEITREMLIIKRPAFGIKPKFIDILIGRKARVDIEKDQWISWDMI